MHSKIEDLSEIPYIRMAVVADSGFGKTVFAGTSPNALFITTDPEGTASARHFGSTAKQIRCYDQKSLINAQLDLLEGLEDRFDWLWIDDLTTVQYIYARTSMENRVRRQYQKGRKPNEKPSEDEQLLGKVVALVEGEGNLNRYVPEQNDRYTHQNATIDFVKWCAQLNMNVGFICKRMMSSYTINDDGTDDGYWTAAIEGRSGAVAQLCLGYTNIIASGDVTDRKSDGKTVRRMFFDHVGRHRGKDRTGTLGRAKDDLDVPTMMQLIESGTAEDTAGEAGEEVASPPARPRPRKRVS
jgi:hypothetical protein